MAWTEKLPSGRYRGGYIDALGVKRQRGGFVHKTAARAWAEDGEERARRGDTFDANAGRTLFRDWAQRWQEARVVEASTAASEAARFAEVVEKWGDWPVAAIGSLEVQAWIKGMGASRQPATVRKYHGLLSVILTAAIRPPHRLIIENPCRHVTLPPVPKGREVFLTEAQVDALVAELDRREDGQAAKPWGTLAMLLAYTGLRWGEAAGLHVNRVDWMRRRIQVAEVIGQSTGKGSVPFHLKAYPKGGTQRLVPMPDHLVERLSRHVAEHPPKPCGLHDDCSGLMFGAVPRYGPPGGPVSRQTFIRWVFGPAARRAGLPANVRPHDLRHTYASWLAQRGVPLREVQYLLGHASITTTERYSHFAPDAGEAARAALDRGKIRGNQSSMDGN